MKNDQQRDRPDNEAADGHPRLAAAMIGAGFIMADPIFQDLAISLVFGLASSTALTVLTIPAVYVRLRDDHQPLGEPAPQ